MRSMTGYGHGEHLEGATRVVVDIKSVNRKQAEVHLFLPHELEPLENKAKELVNSFISRGRCEVRVKIELPEELAAARLNRNLAAAYAREFRSLSNDLGLAGAASEVTLELLARCPGVLQADRDLIDAETAWGWLEPALRKALAAFNEMRSKEGDSLSKDLAGRIASLRQILGEVGKIAPEVLKRFREQLIERIRLAGLDQVDPHDERVLKEVVIFADRSDISEEMARLESHFLQFDDCVGSREPVGRKLDFLAQEMNREINTIGSKANDARIASSVVQMKTELERFREQAQNVE